MRRKIIALLLFIGACQLPLHAQVLLTEDTAAIDFSNPRTYTIGGITVSGIKYLDEGVLKTLSGLSVGDNIKIPGEKISDAIENLWKQNLLSDIKIEYTRIEGNTIFLNLALQELPRMSKFSFTGVSKSEADKLREKINLVTGKIVNENLLKTTAYEIKGFFKEKGYFNVQVDIDVTDDTTSTNTQTLLININKNKRVKIHEVIFKGTTAINEAKLKKYLKNTKEKHWYKIFSSSKFIEESFEEDKKRVIDKYREKGYRDAKITFDTLYAHDENTINIEITISEGQKYYFRNITWIGNSKYSTQLLTQLLGIKKGDVYNQARLDEGLFMSQSGRDVTSLYMDDGYLFFQVNPVEVRVENDSIDIEMRIYEGKQATVDKVTVTGNSKTNDKVVMREIRTKPGELFSRNDIIRTQRELAQLGYFDPEKLNVTPKPNPVEGTVDIEYIVEEKPSDQVELSGGWGAGMIVGTLGVSFNNFSASNIFKKGTWSPLPTGDGQRLSLRAQTNGSRYQSYNISFTEPWLGGRKPNSLSLSYNHTIQTNGSTNEVTRSSMTIDGVSVGLGKRLKWPDDYFSIYYEVRYEYYSMRNFSSAFLFSDGISHNLSFQTTLSRNSVDAPIYPRKGTNMAFTVQFTPPYSLYNGKDYSNATDQEKYKFIEYHKWKFTTSWFFPIAGNKLVLASKATFGFLGFYNEDIGQSPFERYFLGGDGLSGYSLDGREVIAHRGYSNASLSPAVGGSIYDKFSMELRFPVSLNPNATLYALGFFEAGYSWLRFKDFNPFQVKRAAGFGVRIFLPMFGLLGLDWGYGFDRSYVDPPSVKSHGPEFQFTLGQFF